MEILTNSRGKAFRRCARLHHLQYELGYRPTAEAEALRFGTLVHAGLEAWWRHLGEGRLVAAFIAMAELGEADPFAAASAEELLRGYHARWSDSDLSPIVFLDGTVGVEVEFRTPLVNPETGAPSKTFTLGGKLDVLARDGLGRTVIVEHKTSSENITAGSPYWAKLRMDSQVSTYFGGATALGHPADLCVYDVIAKPKVTPALATPIEKREYIKPKYKACPECKKKLAPPAPHTVEGVTCEPDPETGKGRLCTDPGGRLYAGMRDADETPEEYRLRLRADIAARPEEYFARGEVVRLESEVREYAQDTWQTAATMRDYRRLAIAPRNPDACFQFGCACSFFDVCTGAASLDDTTRFSQSDNKHPELAAESAA